MNKQHNYNTLDDYLKNKYKQKVFKVALNGNFTCPNRDGTISSGGCIFCSSEGSGEFAGKRGTPLKEQFEEVKNIISIKWPNSLYIAYFQANTNTYGPIDKLKSLYYEAINLDPNIVALSVATRPDCLSDEVISLLAEINKIKPVWVELGLQTTNEKTAKLINRGYKNEVFYDAVSRLRKHNIDCIVHIINGLPYETSQDMLNTIKDLNSFDIQGIKIHSLYVLKNTPLEVMYNNQEFSLMSLDKYIEITAKQLELLNPNIIIHRISGDAPKDQLVAPLWGLKKFVVMNELDKYMKNNNIHQGDGYYKKQE